MAKPARARNTPEKSPTNRRGHWSDEIAKARRRWTRFHERGRHVLDRYLLERENAEHDLYQDRYNILYSSTETAKPSLYTKTPKVQADKRHKDRENQTVTYASLMLEAVTQYAIEEVDFDHVMEQVVEDYLLPGLGQAWVRYEPQFANAGTADEYVSYEGLDVDYVHWQDFITGNGRSWKELPWVARRVYFNKERATKRFGADKAARMSYSFAPADDGRQRDHAGIGGAQAIIWEIWDKENRKVVWFSEDYGPDVLDEVDDPLHLKDFWPCPRPLRAIWTTRTFIPKAYYSQYKAQAEELDNITERIRHLTQALRAIGVYDGSQTELANLLTGRSNKMVPVQNWAAFAQSGGLTGAVQWVPVKEVALVLTELFRQREIVKNEIYEITGFSDIVRGVSKASETLGAQEIKANWATGRLKSEQKEVQRFCRDLIRIISEITVEHFAPESLALYSGFEPPEVTPQEQQAAAQYSAAMMAVQAGQLPVEQMPPQPPPTKRQEALNQFKKVVELLKNEKQRCALVGIETDSTIEPDQAAERKDRMEFLSAVGAFLQQAGPMALQYPDMRGLLGAIMMFTIRTFPSSRAVEVEFEQFAKKLAEQPSIPPPGAQGDNPESAKATAQGAVEQEKIKAQVSQADTQAKTMSDKYKADLDAAVERERIASNERIKMAELALKDREVRVKEAELGIKQQAQEIEGEVAALEQQRADRQQVHQEQVAEVQEDRAERQQAHQERVDATGARQQERQIDVAEKTAKQRNNRPKNGG